jgi:hypothetical protein
MKHVLCSTTATNQPSVPNTLWHPLDLTVAFVGIPQYCFSSFWYPLTCSLIMIMYLYSANPESPHASTQYPALLPAHAYQYQAKEPYSDTVKARHHLVVLNRDAAIGV